FEFFKNISYLYRFHLNGFMLILIFIGMIFAFGKINSCLGKQIPVLTLSRNGKSDIFGFSQILSVDRKCLKIRHGAQKLSAAVFCAPELSIY
ncbi:hypothetical protein QUF90_12550, partial [Desulfococcaceae bacterium HSG9]|nr:hypothetical protein [Desulfococcaceae bacterium HSG9]